MVAGLGSCGDGGSRPLVLAASSLTDAFRALPLEANAEADYSFAGSQVVLAQVEQGAPADVIAVADPELLPADAVVFARNAVVVVAAAGSSVDDVADLAAPGTRVVLAGASVPVGAYARDGLAELGLLAAVLDNVVSREPDVKSVAAKVGLGEADAGVVYATDARADERLRVVGDPLPVEAVYAAAVVDGAPHPEEARRFVEFLTSPDAQRVFRAHGFT